MPGARPVKAVVSGVCVLRFTYLYMAMLSLDTFKINLKGLEEDDAVFTFSLGDSYFEAVEAPDVRRGSVSATLTVHKGGSFYELRFHIEGSVKVQCDVCLEDMDQPIDTDGMLIVKLGEEYSEDDDVITIDRDKGIIDVSWFIYEFIALDVPIKHVHAPGKCNPAMIKALEEHSAARSSEGDGGGAVDSRWSELEKLKTIIKD